MSIIIALIKVKSFSINELILNSHTPNFSVFKLSASILENMLENVDNTLFHLINNAICGLKPFFIIYVKEAHRN